MSPEQLLVPSVVGKAETAAAVHQPWPSECLAKMQAYIAVVAAAAVVGH